MIPVECLTAGATSAADVGITAPSALLIWSSARGHDEPQQQADRPEKPEVVERDAGGARDPALVQPLDAGPHRRCDHHREQEQRNEHLELPERECAGDHGRRATMVATNDFRAVSLIKELSPLSGAAQDRAMTNACSLARMTSNGG